MTGTLGEAPVLNVRFADQDFVDAPWATLEKIRAAGPVVYSAGPIAGDLAPADGYMITGHQACSRVLANPAKFAAIPEWFVNKFGGLVFEAFDASPHDEFRAVWSYEFQRATLQERRRDLVDEVVDQHVTPFLDRVLAGETLDAVALLHGTIPLFVILRMMGLDTSDHEMLGKWASELSGIAPVDGTESLNAYLTRIVRDRRTGDGDDLISLMARSAIAAELDERDVVANTTQLVFAGSGTTTSLMSSCLLLLAEHPDQRRALHEDRSLIPQAIEEALRLRTVAQLAAPRLVTDGDAEIEGVRVPEGATVVCLLGAANRDPSRWDHAGEFDIFRERKQHLGFGYGLHNCLGLNLARLEVETYLNKMLDRLPEWRLAGPVDVHVDAFVGVESLPVSAP
jgi:cytochrome P450